VAAYLPPGWPAGVHPPGTDGFEQTAVTWLLDVLPADYRVHGVLRRHPVALAAVARHSVEAGLQVYQDDGRRLVDAARAAGLVGRALRGETFTPAMAQGRPAKRRPTGN
jgi:hypothetical protein